VARLVAIGELTASLAHELNQPLAAIAANAGACVRWLSGPAPDIDEARAAAQRIADDAQRGGDVIRQTRRLAWRSEQDRSPFDIGDAIREVLIFVAAEIRSRGIIVRQSLDEDLPRVSGVRVQIQQVVLNLVLNGIEAITQVSDRTRELAISATRVDGDDGRGVLVAVRDVGVGLAHQHVGRLFTAFYTRKPDGVGLGLSISQSIVQDHGGRLWATANPDGGATFSFVLPAL
jgi:C4-dicarboxylate-specific signal transduction histidine kinase